MAETEFKAEPFRYVNLLLFMFVGIQTQIMWVTFAPAIHYFATFYNVSDLAITLLGALFMIMYIPVNYFATKHIDKYGLKKGVGIGVMLTGIGSLIRPLGGNNYWIVFVGQLLAAIGQPYVLNCWSKLGTNWFLEKEKATSVGLGELSIFTGIIIAMLFPIEDVGPIITLWIYAIIGLISMVLYLIFTRDKPENPPNEFAIKDVKISSTKGMKDIMFKNKDFLLLFFVIFIGLGIFNAITTEIDSIFNDAYYPNVDSGTVSALMILGGVLGSIILSQISDQLGKRKIFLILALFGGVLFSILMAIFKDPSEIYFFSALYGFLLVACLPIGLTYGAEITYPYPEETSAGLLMTGGQISGVIFLFFPLNMYLYFCAALFLIGLILTFFLRDTKEIKEERLKKQNNKIMNE